MKMVVVQFEQSDRFALNRLVLFGPHCGQSDAFGRDTLKPFLSLNSHLE